MRIYILPLLILSSLAIVTPNISANTATNEITPFDELTNSIFKDEYLTGPFHIPVSEVEYRAFTGSKYLYCSVVADFIRKNDKAADWYDRGMILVDDYVKTYAIRDTEAYKTLRYKTSFSSSIPFYHQTWLIDDKDILKGVIFNSIYRVLSDEFYRENPLGDKNYVKFNQIILDKCSKL